MGRFERHRRSARLATAGRLFLALIALSLFGSPSVLGGDLLFREAFDDGLSAWAILGEHAARVVDSGGPEHGSVLELFGDGLVVARIRGSESWGPGPIRLEARFRFPTDDPSYLGVVWAFDEAGPRVDFGNVYLKSPQGYVRVNPFRDGNASRLLYEEYRTPLEGDRAPELDRWQDLAAEIRGDTIHLYLGDSPEPVLTFSDLERSAGSVGFHPRIVGGPVQIDDVRVARIPELSWKGPPRPEIAYRQEALLTEWEVLGPFPAPVDQRIDGPAELGAGRWRPFSTDARGAVVTGRVTEYLGGRPVAYFRTFVESDGGPARLHLSTTDELALWVDGRFHGFVYRDGYVSGENDWNAWWDFWQNPSHAGRRMGIELRPGRTEIRLRARAGQFASGGFFARLER